MESPHLVVTLSQVSGKVQTPIAESPGSGSDTRPENVMVVPGATVSGPDGLEIAAEGGVLPVGGTSSSQTCAR